ncbi:sodium-dependent transporter [Streptomyces sp. NPDC049967]|uniref:bile acid:sodium symporter family protein n=1 Tax=unclassified Streptomyces TaxID=2593676 RepID=UPI002E2B4660|nr:sodium-dependent transporter [Streptomyces sp. NBC_00342]
MLTVTEPAHPMLRPLEFLRRRLGWVSCAAYTAAAVLPGPGVWLRRVHGVSVGTDLSFGVNTAQILLAAVLFTAGLRSCPQALTRILRRPRVLLAGLVLHLTAPLLIIPGIAFALRCSPDSDGGSGMTAAMILTVAMPVAAGATVWSGGGRGDESTMLGLVLGSTLISPLTIPATVGALTPLLSPDYAHVLASAAQNVGGGFALTGVLLPCVAGIVCRLLLPAPVSRAALPTAALGALLASLVLTYINASGAIGQFLTHPRPLLLVAGAGTASLVCGLSFAWGHLAVRVLRLEARAGTSVTLACGMSNSSAGAVLISTAMPDRPQILLPVLAYSLLQKLLANRFTRARAEGTAAA